MKTKKKYNSIVTIKNSIIKHKTKFSAQFSFLSVQDINKWSKSTGAKENKAKLNIVKNNLN